MNHKNIENSIVRYLTQEATSVDLDTLSVWIQNPNNEKIFENYVKIYYEVTIIMNEPNVEAIKKNLLTQIKRNKNPFYNKKFKNALKYAAAAILVFGLGYFYQNNFFSNPTDSPSAIINNIIEAGTDKAILTLQNGKEIALVKGEAYQANNVISNGEKIVYNTTNNQQLIIDNYKVYNYLTIPRGGQFHITLSDGTEVWLNSESKLKYPVNFSKGKIREVELVYGEAYFDVSPSAFHKGAKFKVYHNNHEVEVFGTQFNVKAYRDEVNIYTTLVEGKIGVRFAGREQKLNPNQQLNVNLANNSLVTLEVDIYNEVSWKEGIFSFEKKSLFEMMKVLSRWYDIDVLYTDIEVGSVQFTGVLGKEQTLDEILSTIKNTNNINYEIKEKMVVFN
ncbi:FecR domain-containing protein [uncultured Polaribacter sp.]|uniref:FecR family protein n=1 Tax=uncultured Polaribacter sp. TaxID=174711 RepID=UPI002628B850|nr:FecR domain-containing protein [uncultured Polaribacter sp.]